MNFFIVLKKISHPKSPSLLTPELPEKAPPVPQPGPSAPLSVPEAPTLPGPSAMQSEDTSMCNYINVHR